MRKTKFYAWVLAAAMAVGGFAGCTDDENDNKKYDENGNEIVDKPGGDVELKEKRVAKIFYGQLEDGGLRFYYGGTKFGYSEDGRIIRMTDIESIGGGNEFEETPYTDMVNYGTSKVVVYAPDGHTFCEFDLEDGRAVKWTYREPVPGNEEEYKELLVRTYKYTDGILTEMVEEDKEYDVPVESIVNFEVKDGAWTGGDVYVEGEKARMTIEMSDVENNLSVDLYYTIFHIFATWEYNCLLGLTGERMKYLPEKVSIDHNGIMTTLTYKYVLDDEGYVTDIDIHYHVPYADEPSERDLTEIRKIEYE